MDKPRGRADYPAIDVLARVNNTNVDKVNTVAYILAGADIIAFLIFYSNLSLAEFKDDPIAFYFLRLHLRA